MVPILLDAQVKLVKVKMLTPRAEGMDITIGALRCRGPIKSLFPQSHSQLSPLISGNLHHAPWIVPYYPSLADSKCRIQKS